MPDGTPSEAPQVKPFAAYLQEHRRGGLHDDLSSALQELVGRCVETGKKGSLTLKLTFAPQKDEVTMLVTDDLKVVAPKHDSKPALFFPDEHGNLLLSDPRQLQIGTLREVPAAPSATREVKEAKAQ